MKYLALLATIAISLGGVACKKSAAAASTVPVTVSIFPTATQSVLPGGSVTFTATVANTSNTAVNWEVNNNVGGDATTGLITTAGVYTAPSAVINPFDVTVTAQSQADTTKIASTTVAIILPPPIALDVTSLTLPAGGTHQFTATTTPTGEAVVWQVNGSSAFGTITPGGLYTAPQVPPPGGTATIQGALQSDTGVFVTATVTVTYSNASLNGSYAFLLRGSDASGLLLRAGSFTADGKGNITAGIEDINNGVNLVQSGVSFTGSYNFQGAGNVGGDGRGSITFNDGFNGNTAGAGNSKFSAVIVSAQQAQMEELDTFASASGQADIQDASSFNSASFHGEYSFDFSGADAAVKPTSAVGQFFADGTGSGASQPALEDLNDGGTLTSNVATTFSSQPVGANSRGLAMLNGASYAFYMVSAAQAKFIAIGNPSSAVSAGIATLQSGAPFNAVSLGGNSLLITNGSGATGPVSGAARFFAQANADNVTGTFGSAAPGTLTINNSGNVSGADFTGTYAVNPATGRGTASLSTGQTYVFYMIGVNQTVIQETDSSSVSDGSLLGLSGGPFSISAGNQVNGYALQLTGISANGGEQDALGQIDLTGGQVATGTVDVNTASGAGAMTAFTPTPGVAIPAGTTYSVTNNQGPLNVTVSGTKLMFQAYFLSPTSLFLLRTDMTDARVLHGNLYQDISLSPAIVSANSVQFSVSVASTFTVVAAGIPAATITESGTLPSGITFDQNTGVLSGTPAAGTGGTTTQSYPITFTATNGVGSPAVQNFTLTIVQCVVTSGTCS